MKRWQFSLAGLFLVTTVTCVSLGAIRDERVCVVTGVSMVAMFILSILAVTSSLSFGEDVPDLDD